MIKGTRKVRVTPEDILEKITPYDIYRFYLGNFTIGKSFKSPFHRDRHPSFSVRRSKTSGELYHIDYSHGEYTGSCFKLVMQLWNLSFEEALEKVDNDFGLGIGGGRTRDYVKICSQWEEPPAEKKKYCHILVVTRPMTLSELSYWNQYHLSADDLKRGEVYGIQKVYMNRRLAPNYSRGPQFAYRSEIEGKDHWKIYRPKAVKGEKFFPNNIPTHYIEDLERMRGAEKTLVTKSRKDRMVCRKILDTVCSTQNESPGSILDEDAEFLQSECGKIFIGFDNDEPGKKASRHYTATYGWQHINVPDPYGKQGLTDFSDMAKAFGLGSVEAHFRLKGLLL